MLGDKHTPGPWRVGTVSLHANHFLRESAPRCVMAGDEGEEPEDVAYVTLCEDEEMEANARLLAAAPDMLAALRDVEAHHVALNGRIGRDESRSRTLAIVREAILDATGVRP